MESFTKVRKNHFGFVMNFTGKRKLDGKPICAKQVPKAKIANWDDYDGRRIPREFKLHILASEIEGVVKVKKLWFAQKLNYLLGYRVFRA